MEFGNNMQQSHRKKMNGVFNMPPPYMCINFDKWAIPSLLMTNLRMILGKSLPKVSIIF